jgi:tumor protein p53-inducible protein 3
MALLQGGGYAGYATAYECTTMHAPAGLDMVTLASIPEQWITAYQLLFHIGQIKRGETVLLHAASSGVGQAAIQLAKDAGARVIATCRSDDKKDCCLGLGADIALNVRDIQGFSDVIRSQNSGNGVDVILDCVGASYTNDNLAICNLDARWVLYGTMGGRAIHDDGFLGKLMAKRISILPSTLRGRSKAYKNNLIRGFEADVVPKIANGTFKIIVSSVHQFTTEGVRCAHKIMSRNENIGKIVLSIREDVP